MIKTAVYRTLRYRSRLLKARFRQWTIFLALTVWTVLLIPNVYAQPSLYPGAPQCPEEQRVNLGDVAIFCSTAGNSTEAAKQRAAELSQRLEAIANLQGLQPDQFQFRWTPALSTGTTGDSDAKLQIISPQGSLATGSPVMLIEFNEADLQDLRRSLAWQNIPQDLLSQKILSLLQERIQDYRNSGQTDVRLKRASQCQFASQIVRLGNQPLFCIRTWIQTANLRAIAASASKLSSNGFERGKSGRIV